MADKEIGRINKGEFQGTVTDVVVAVREFNGRVGVDIREYATSDKYTGPTKKGLRIPADRFEDFRKMINSISESDLVVSGDSQNSSSDSGNGSANIPTQKPGQEELPDY